MKDIFGLKRWIEGETVNCLLTKLCQCFIRLRHLNEYQKEREIIHFLARLLEYDYHQFKKSYETIKRYFLPQDNNSDFWLDFINPIVDKMDFIDESYILDVISKERGV